MFETAITFKKSTMNKHELTQIVKAFDSSLFVSILGSIKEY